MSRILLLSPDLARNVTYPPWQVAGSLRRLGHEAVLAGPASGPFWPPLAEQLKEAVVLGEGWVDRPGWERSVDLAARSDLIYPFKALPTSLGLGLALRQRTGQRLALHLDDWDAGYLSGAPLLRRFWYGIKDLSTPRGLAWLQICDALTSRADVISVSTKMLQDRYGGTILRQGVDTDLFSPQRFTRENARLRLGIPASEPMVLFLGTPAPHKGLAALEVLDGPLAKGVWLVGASREDWIRAGVGPGLLKAAHLHDSVSVLGAAWYMAASDIFVIPQTASAFAQYQLPAKLLQAMSMGCCVVASEVGDIREILGGPEPAGILLPPDDPAQLGETLQSLVREPERRGILGARARSRAERALGWDAMGRTLVGILREAGIHDA